MIFMLCPVCGSKRIIKLVEKGFQFLCLDCGYVGNMIEDVK